MRDTPRLQQLLAVVLAMTAGYVDAYGLLSYQTYLSFMSGNTTQTGSQIGQEHLALAVKRVPLPDARGPWDTHAKRALLLFSVWLSFLTGALVSGAGTLRFGTKVLLVPLLVMLVLATLNPPPTPTADADS